MKTYIAVGIGGIIGAVGRYSVSLLFETNGSFPFATLIANLLGCLLLSFLYNQDTIKRSLSPILFTAIGTGMIGSFTTFSTFSVETIKLWQANGLLALTYIVISIFGGLACCYFGFRIAKRKEVQS